MGPAASRYTESSLPASLMLTLAPRRRNYLTLYLAMSHTHTLSLSPYLSLSASVSRPRFPYNRSRREPRLCRLRLKFRVTSRRQPVRGSHERRRKPRSSRTENVASKSEVARFGRPISPRWHNTSCRRAGSLSLIYFFGFSKSSARNLARRCAYRVCQLHVSLPSPSGCACACARVCSANTLCISYAYRSEYDVTVRRDVSY